MYWLLDRQCPILFFVSPVKFVKLQLLYFKLQGQYRYQLVHVHIVAFKWIINSSVVDSVPLHFSWKLLSSRGQTTIVQWMCQTMTRRVFGLAISHNKSPPPDNIKHTLKKTRLMRSGLASSRVWCKKRFDFDPFDHNDFVLSYILCV